MINLTELLSRKQARDFRMMGAKANRKGKDPKGLLEHHFVLLAMNGEIENVTSKQMGGPRLVHLTTPMGVFAASYDIDADRYEFIDDVQFIATPTTN
ncbi:hypothetical protein [Vibrio sp. WXL210]|uniref:hypothetical protein n=1 Tax=Vibrio sp. WXL210 TaxID=3450709 RepID=UPI003EC4B77E